MKTSFRGLVIYFIVIAALLAIFVFGNQKLFSPADGPLSDGEVFESLDKGEITWIDLEPIKVGTADMGNALLHYDAGEGKTTTRSFYVSSISEFRTILREKYPDVKVYADPVKEDSVWAEILPMIRALGLNSRRFNCTSLFRV